MDLDVNIILQLYKERVAQLEHELILERTLNRQLEQRLQESDKEE